MNIIYKSAEHPISIVLDDDDYALQFEFNGKNYTTDMPASSVDLILASLEQGDDSEETEDLYRTIVEWAVDDLKAAFPGVVYSYSHERSELTGRASTPEEQRDAQNKVAYRDLINSGLSHDEIFQLLN
ncbi:MAG: hypothetical protein OEZ68_15715 [Gammaproteobacteria bacterium]|nr:hypothetical protein [Gammaproteobacteria bacterium]MDH5802248.1 hypothetical protein [Gammaproteobacteria bacterium]